LCGKIKADPEPKHHAIKAYRGACKIPRIRISTLDEGEWSASRSSHFTQQKGVL